MQDQENISPVDQFVIDFVRELRLKKNITQQELADIMGLSRSFIKSIESPNSRAKFNVRHINSLADYFGISPREFLPVKAFPVDIQEIELKPNKRKKVSSKK
jgi:transcriptional regulator with XRE-family HTH domain